MALFIILFGAAIFLGLEILHRSDLEAVTAQILELQAYYCAEAGVERAIYEARSNRNWPTKNGTVTWVGGEGDTPACTLQEGAGDPASHGTYTVSITRSQVDSNWANWCFNNYTLLTIDSTGVIGGGRFTRRVRAKVRRSCFPANGSFTQILSWEELQ